MVHIYLHIDSWYCCMQQITGRHTLCIHRRQPLAAACHKSNCTSKCRQFVVVVRVEEETKNKAEQSWSRTKRRNTRWTHECNETRWLADDNKLTKKVKSCNSAAAKQKQQRKAMQAATSATEYWNIGQSACNNNERDVIYIQVYVHTCICICNNNTVLLLHANHSQGNNNYQTTNNDNNGVQIWQHAAVCFTCKMQARSFFCYFENFNKESGILAPEQATIGEIGAP